MAKVSAGNSFIEDDWELTTESFAGSLSKARAAQIEAAVVRTAADDSTITITGTLRRRVIVQRFGSDTCHQAEANWSISLKCLGVAIAILLFYTKATMVGNILTIFGKATTIVKERRQNDEKIQKGSNSPVERAKNIFGAIFDIVGSTIFRIWYAVRAFFYGVAMFGAALYGIVSQKAGRSYIVKIESKWHGGSYYTTGIERIKNEKKELELPPLARIVRQLFFRKESDFSICVSTR